MSDNNNSPNHIAIILDGNRRFAKRLMLEPWRGHEFGRVKVENLLDWAHDLGVKELTVYALSSENIVSRPKKELDMLMKIFRDAFRSLDNDKIVKNENKIRFVGHLELLPKELQVQCEELMAKTSKYNKYVVNFAIAYGGRQEIVDAVRKIISNKLTPEDVSIENFNDYLYVKNDPDMIIRTGGEKRSSNFLPWQSTYSEWFFLDKMWPDFSKEDLVACIEEFHNRKRRFGK
ncbi:di-trans,poly-cis-decaprenylcistransferase [Candidatus Pacearchaeota archaeon CG10_big_fil_rev_8_21_14_0_10_35_13]|nr:MAG: di-trans,poly-cis-decaprenylcistransferase [Candidatus Pacearchaeota archaeon CG10_big_fil_rev_8_21_14_0_10_35_13]